MSTTFDDRESTFETKFAHDEAALFRAEARAVKNFALWLAETYLGMAADQANAYAADLVIANLDTPGLDDVVGRADNDLKAKGVAVPRAVLADKLNAFFADAKNKIATEGK